MTKEKVGKYPFEIGKFVKSFDYEILPRVSMPETLGIITTGYFNNSLDLFGAFYDVKIPVLCDPIFSCLPLGQPQTFELVTMPSIAKKMRAMGAKDLPDFTYDLVLRVAEEDGLAPCPWESALYRILMFGSEGFNKQSTLSFVTQPFDVDGMPHYPVVQRSSHCMWVSALPITNIINDLAFLHPIAFARKIS